MTHEIQLVGGWDQGKWIATTEHPQSSYGIPVVIDGEGRAYGPRDLHYDFIAVPDGPYQAAVAWRLAAAGWRIGVIERRRQ